MSFQGVLAYKGDPNVSMKEVRAEMKAGKIEMGKEWHSKMLPRHFQLRNASKYGMRPRKTGYLKSKQKRVGHRNPWVFKGDTKSLATSRVKVSGTTTIRVGFQIPRYAWSLRRFGIDPSKELLAVTDEEFADLGSGIDKHMDKALKQGALAKRTVRV